MTAGSGPKLFPQPFEPMPGNTGVMGGMLGIAVAEVVLHGSEVGALVGKVIAAGMAEHVGPDPAELRLLAGHAHDVVDGLASELCAALGHEQPGQVVSMGRHRKGARPCLASGQASPCVFP